MQVEEEIIWQCQYCGTHNYTSVDITMVGKQDFIEDCRICSRPTRVVVTIDRDDNVMVDCRLCDE